MAFEEPVTPNSILLAQAREASNLFEATGENVVWAVVDSGIDGDHPHFKKWSNLDIPAPLQHLDFTTEDAKSPLTDSFGHGTSLAGAIAGEAESGYLIRRIQGDREVHWETVRLSGILGLAPKAKLLSVKVLNPNGDGDSSTVIQALSAIQELNHGQLRVHGVCLGLYYPYDPELYSCGQSPVCQAVNELVRSGVVVVAAAGNGGYGKQLSTSYHRLGGIAFSIEDPGNAELAITVGACHAMRPDLYGVSYFSAKGPTLDGRDKPDLVAPGERIVCPGRPFDPRAIPNTLTENGAFYREESGTSIAVAVASGAIAAMLSARQEFVGKPEALKRRLVETARDLGRRREHQGYGMLNLLKAMQPKEKERAQAVPAERKLHVVISYAHVDETHMNVLRTHLKGLELRGLIEVWHDRDLRAGDKWGPEIETHLETADIVILLLSASFVASENCYEKELPIAMRRQEEGKTRVVPVLLRPFDVAVLPLANFNLVPKNQTAITEWTNPDAAWVEVAQQVRRVVENITGTSADVTRLVPSR